MQKISFIFLTAYLVLVCSFLIFVACHDNEFAEFDEDGNDGNWAGAASTPSVPPIQSASVSSSPDHANTPRSESKPSPEKVAHSSSESDEYDEGRIEASKRPVGKRPDLKVVDAPPLKVYYWDDYYVEIAFVLVFLLFLVNFLVGSSRNNSFLVSWYNQSRGFLKYEFALVGGAPKIDEPNASNKKDDDSNNEASVAAKKQRGLIKSTESIYTLWCSGRTGMDGLLIEFNFLKRQDLIQMAMNLVMPSQDRIILRFLLSNEGYDNFVFCLAHKSYVPKLTRDCTDISTFCSKRKPITQYGVDSDKLFVMTELTDVVPFIFDERAKEFFKRYERSINYIHITDQFSTNRSEDALPAQKLANTKRLATFSFAFPFASTQTIEYLLFALDTLDRLRKFKLARDSKQKSDKNRQKITDIIQKAAFSQRQEAAQSKKEELRRAEKERIFSEDDVNKQRAWEKKEAKREHKKKMRMKPIKIKP